MSTFHPSFWAALFGWLVAQTIKMACSFIETKRLDFSYMVSTGGMPSAHSAMAATYTFTDNTKIDVWSVETDAATGAAVRQTRVYYEDKESCDGINVKSDGTVYTIIR